jgi:glycerophosphoryl diester phosphodiesterase
VIAQYSLATRKLLNEVHASGKSLYVWTVNRYSSMVRLAGWGVDGLISDRTDVLGQLAPSLSHSPFTPR